MRILVTGITGKSGLFFYSELKKQDPQIDFLGFIVRDNVKAEKLLTADIKQKIHVGDLQDKNFLVKIMQEGQYDTLLHIAGIQKSLLLVKTALSCGIKRLILVHTTGIYSKYKVASEEYRKIESKIDEMIKGKNISLSILRPTMIYGNCQDKNVSEFVKMVDKLRLFPVVNGANYELQPVWCGDLGKAYYDVLMNPAGTKNKNYVLSGGKPILLKDMLIEISNQLGVKNTFISVPFWLAYSGAWFIFVLTLGKIDYREKVQRLVEPRVYSHEEARKDFGYNPICFEEGVTYQINEYKRVKSKVVT